MESSFDDSTKLGICFDNKEIGTSLVRPSVDITMTEKKSQKLIDHLITVKKTAKPIPNCINAKTNM